MKVGVALRAGLCAACLWSAAAAQEAFPAPPETPIQWQAVTSGDIRAAILRYDVGITVSAICRNTQFLFAIEGLPPAADGATFRKLEVNVPDDDLVLSTWSVHNGLTLALSPAVYARRLRSTEQFIIRVPAQEGQPRRRYDLILPEDHAALDQALAACDLPLEATSDAAYDPSVSAITWIVQPRVSAPDRLPRGGHAEVLIECVVAEDGRPDSCRIIEETPPDSGFARSALANIRTGRLGSLDGSPVTAGRSFRTRMVIRVTDN